MSASKSVETVEQFARDDAELLDSQPLYQGFFSCQGLTLRHRLFAGGWSEDYHRELFERGNAAAVLLYDAARDSVALVEQFRVGALASTLPGGERPTPWLFEVVAGIIEPGETAEAVARRESEEEAGCVIGELEHIAGYYPSPGACSEYIELFCASVDSAELGGLHGLSDEHEDIRLHVLTRDQAWQWLLEGRLNNASTLIAMQWLQMNVTRLRQQW
ncbi:ADP-ribose pyrophosphatase [Sinobacterium caligoides]|uniref:ADP-ribose pyrophosphatase n=1 Tax=Sinobacterium caligoides TaxID=933926 RepID=A0A3N2D4N0_9GAMM|nr:NUDIX domain-containing protein [Sinobacterium caligoides]ROR94755.1 ADP-ribose pyrophosphatase [Sinobacterium caligoides]